MATKVHNSGIALNFCLFFLLQYIAAEDQKGTDIITEKQLLDMIES